MIGDQKADRAGLAGRIVLVAPMQRVFREHVLVTYEGYAPSNFIRTRLERGEVAAPHIDDLGLDPAGRSRGRPDERQAVEVQRRRRETGQGMRFSLPAVIGGRQDLGRPSEQRRHAPFQIGDGSFLALGAGEPSARIAEGVEIGHHRFDVFKLLQYIGK